MSTTTKRPYSTTSTTTSKQSTALSTTNSPYSTTPITTSKPSTATNSPYPITSTTKMSTTTSKPYTTTTSTSTSRPYTKLSTITNSPYSATPTTSSKPSTTTNNPYSTTSITTSKQSTALSTINSPYSTTPTTTSKPSTTTNMMSTTTSKPYTAKFTTTNSPYSTTSTTNNPYSTTSSHTTKLSTTTTKPYTTITITTNSPYLTTSRTSSRPYTTKSTTTNKPYTITFTTTSKQSTIKSTKTNMPYSTPFTTTSKRYISTTSPPRRQCPEMNGIFRNPQNCGSFLHCSNWIPYIQQCPSGLHFNIEKQICDYPCDAKCDKNLNCTATAKPELSAPDPLPFCTKKGLLTLQKVFVDITSIALEYSLSNKNVLKGYILIPQKRVCDIPKIAGCGKLSKPLPSPDLYEECSCETCLSPSKYNCLEYFLCLNSTAYRMKCSDGFLFDKKLNTCNLANRVACDSTTTTAPSTTQYTRTTTNLPYTTEPTTSRPYTTESTTQTQYTTITTTAAGTTIIQPYTTTSKSHPITTMSTTTSTPYTSTALLQEHNQCPSGLHFNVEKQICDYPCDAKCDKNLSQVQRVAPSTTNARVANQQSEIVLEVRHLIPECPSVIGFIVSTAHTAKSVPEGTDYSPHKDDCHKFVHCANGIPYTKACPAKLYFDPATLRCTYASDKCVTSKSPGATEEESKSPDATEEESKSPFATEETSKSTVATEEESKSPGATEEESKSPGATESKSPEELKSPGATKEESKLYEPVEQKWKCPKGFGYYIHEGNCSNFYQCIDGIPSLKQCPEGLFFNSKLGMCDWAAQVNCLVDQSHLQRLCRRYDRKVDCPSERSNKPTLHCNMFYDCRTGDACARRCPNGLYFKHKHRCVTFQQMSSVRKVKGGESYSLKNMVELCYAKKRGHMADPASEKCYYKCHHHLVIRSCCSKNRVFNEQKGRCEWKYLL
ncbi:putative chitinase 3 [Caerostris extrusa]|uniref:Chitinase 3 n=1 Tax=Caerostris extrusa TaxID=172846 RepID=A0AAV4MGC2_CAEEX|nr:putative chitinase 3 [Caerostris extrusa]